MRSQIKNKATELVGSWKKCGGVGGEQPCSSAIATCQAMINRSWKIKWMLWFYGTDKPDVMFTDNEYLKVIRAIEKLYKKELLNERNLKTNP